MNTEIEAAEFYVAGGTLRPGSPSYVERPADDELFNLALAGEFCYVLTARQMGKSSLMIRTARRLRAQDVYSVILDLTKIGTEVSVEQWYLGLLTQLKRNLKLSVDLEAWWQKRQAVGHVQRFTDFLHDVVLQEIEGQVVIFMDEIDTTLNLDFSDDFFAAIRFIYNARATDVAYERITFVLLGVATPADLIKDRSRTPFNIGQGIDLSDFSRGDARVLQQGLQSDYPQAGEAIFHRIFYWTNGHPYLTQKLCLSVAEHKNGPQADPHNNVWTNERVDELVEHLFLSKEARKETNLQFVRDSVENSPRRETILKLYRQVYTGKAIAEDERSLDQNRLKLFGLVRSEQGVLQTRNEIYRQIFNLDWIKENTPINWYRRLVVVLGLLVIVLIGVSVSSIYWQRPQQEAREYIDSFRATTDPDERLTSLAGLFDLPNSGAQARELFYGELTPEERLALFETADPTEVGPQLITVVRGLYTGLENNERDNTLLRAMVQPLDQIEDVRASNLATEIKQWLEGRALQQAGEYDQAVGVYRAVIAQNDRNPGTFFDRGLAYAALGEADSALADFEEVLKLDESRQSRIQQVIAGDPNLYEALTTSGSSFPALVALVPTPTSTPTSTSTPTRTPSPTLTPVPTDTPTPTPTPVEPTTTPVVIVAAPTDTPVPLPTDTPSPTPTSTPRPATVVFVQSSGANHDLGLVNSDGVLLDLDLHRRAAAPAWSPNGGEVAFYGEEGISELGGIYAQGNGVWILNVQSDSPRLLFQIDHITNMTWSPDGEKLAFEIGAPGVEIHSVVVIDARDGKEINRFPGEQPAWLPDSAELVIKSCAPECGLWRVGIDGSSSRLLTRDSTDSYPAISPNGEYLVFSSRFRNGDWEVYRVPLADPDAELVRLTNRPGTDTTPVFSPDGLEIYIRTDAFGGWQITAMAVDGSNERIIRADIGQSNDWGLARPAVN
ncbi:MAG TPA: AAA-like domain-containing protein [Anaerolineae bacterium]